MNTRTRRTAVALGALALAFMVALAAVGCGPTAQSTPTTRKARTAVTYSAPASPEPAELAGAAAVNAFGFDLLRTMTAENPRTVGNQVISPLSVHAALAMTLQGAHGTTAAEMQKALHLSGNADAAAKTYALLLDALGHRSKEQTLTVADALWINSVLKVKPEFLNANRVAFGASAKTLDFSKADVPDLINSWVAENTHGMITHVVDRLDPRAVLVLGNAVYFKGEWVEPFNPDAHNRQPFHLETSRTVEVPVMNATRQMPIARGDGFVATRLLYRGLDSSAYLILPQGSHRLADVLDGMTSAKFSALRSKLDAAENATLTALSLPKFDTTVGGSIATPLASMGMPAAFDPDHADFTGIADPTPQVPSIYIGDVIHKARIKVDERGTEAAAATVVEMDTGAVMSPGPEPIPFVCDRPFALVIVDKPTGAILFLAAVRDPNAR